MRHETTKRQAASVSIALLAALSSGDAGRATDASANADYLFTNGKVYTVDELQPWVEAMAIDGNRIVYFAIGAWDPDRMIRESTEKLFTLADSPMTPGRTDRSMRRTNPIPATPNDLSIDGDILDLESPEALLETRILATMTDGKFRHRDGI